MTKNSLLGRHLYFERVNEYRHDHTRQRTFERGFLSRDDPESRAAKHPCSDGGHGAARIRGFDEPPEVCADDLTDAEKDELILAAMERVGHPLMQEMLLEIYCGGNWRTIPARIGISERTYFYWMKKLLKIFLHPCSRRAFS